MSKILKVIAGMTVTAIAAEGIYAALKVNQKLQEGTEETLQDAINSTLIEEKMKFKWWKKVAKSTAKVVQRNFAQPGKVIEQWELSHIPLDVFLVGKAELEVKAEQLDELKNSFKKIW